MGAGFVQWLWGLLKQKLEENERRNAPPLSEEERAAREEAWRRQIQPVESAPRPSPKAPPPIHDPWASVRDVFEQAKEEARKAQAPSPAEPPLLPSRPASAPQRTRPGTVRAEVRPPPPTVLADSFPASPVKTVTPPVFFAPPALPPHVSRATADPFKLGGLLLNPAAARQAVLLREILGPPKALQSSQDSAF